MDLNPFWSNTLWSALNGHHCPTLRTLKLPFPANMSLYKWQNSLRVRDCIWSKWQSVYFCRRHFLFGIGLKRFYWNIPISDWKYSQRKGLEKGVGKRCKKSLHRSNHSPFEPAFWVHLKTLPLQIVLWKIRNLEGWHFTCFTLWSSFSRTTDRSWPGDLCIAQVRNVDVSCQRPVGADGRAKGESKRGEQCQVSFYKCSNS